MPLLLGAFLVGRRCSRKALGLFRERQHRSQCRVNSLGVLERCSDVWFENDDVRTAHVFLVVLSPDGFGKIKVVFWTQIVFEIVRIHSVFAHALLQAVH